MPPRNVKSGKASAHKNRSAETKAAPSTPARGRVEQRKARRSLSGASAKHCLYTCGLAARKLAVLREAVLDAHASYQIVGV
jgi:hypothetical protein